MGRCGIVTAITNIGMLVGVGRLLEEESRDEVMQDYRGGESECSLSSSDSKNLRRALVRLVVEVC